MVRQLGKGRCLSPADECGWLGCRCTSGLPRGRLGFQLATSLPNGLANCAREATREALGKRRERLFRPSTLLSGSVAAISEPSVRSGPGPEPLHQPIVQHAKGGWPFGAREPEHPCPLGAPFCGIPPKDTRFLARWVDATLVNVGNDVLAASLFYPERCVGIRQLTTND